MGRALLVVAVAVAVAVVAAAGCPKHAGPARNAVKRLVLATTAEPDTLCPLLTTSGTAQEAIALVARDLVVEDPSWQTVPDLAASVPTLADGARIVDGKLVVTWRIRPDAAWEDGVPVTAADFVLGFQVQSDPAQPDVAGGADARRIESLVPAADGRSFTVTWRDPNPFFAAPRVHRPLPAHLLAKRLVDAATGKLKPLRDDGYCRHPLSNGPFRLVEWRPGQFLRFARNEHYRPRPKLDEVVVRVLPSTTGILTALAAGDVDAAFPSGGPSPIEARAFVDAHPGFRLESAPGQIWAHIDLNLDVPALKDVRVRRALALALPRKRIVDEVSHGLYDVADGYLPPRHWGYHEAGDDALAYDPARAKALLAAAGVKTPLHLTLSSASGQSESEAMLTLAQAAWKAVGVDVALDLRPFKVFFGEGARKRKTELAFYAWTIDGTSMGGPLWRADRIPGADNGWQGQNLPGWQNDEVTTLLAEADRTLDEPARRALLARVQQLFREELPAIPMYFRPSTALHRAGITGLAPTGTLTPLAWNASSWDVAPAR